MFFLDLTFVFVLRRQIKVDEIFVHENYTAIGSKANDIALLRLGESKVWVRCASRNVLKKYIYTYTYTYIIIRRKS